MRFVATKSIEQQDLLSLHRVRTRLVGQRTALCNQIRGLLAEYGIVLPQSVSRLRRSLPEVMEDGENELSEGKTRNGILCPLSFSGCQASLATFRRKISASFAAKFRGRQRPFLQYRT